VAVFLHFDVNSMMAKQMQEKQREKNNFLIEGSNIPCSHFSFYDENGIGKNERKCNTHSLLHFRIFLSKKKYFFFLFQRTITKKCHEHILTYKCTIGDIS